MGAGGEGRARVGGLVYCKVPGRGRSFGILLVIAAKIGDIPHLNNSTPLVDPSVYGYGVQKRPLDDGSMVMSAAEVSDHGTSPEGELGEVISRQRSRRSRKTRLPSHPTVAELLERATGRKLPGLEHEEAGSLFGAKTAPSTGHPGQPVSTHQACSVPL
ncbi:UNVERIFIED_CONTAM: hypothetical protein K2H54_052211 [Gekko kuhli]